jgi:hypothetical protein
MSVGIVTDNKPKGLLGFDQKVRSQDEGSNGNLTEMLRYPVYRADLSH